MTDDDVPDSTDWLSTPLSGLSAVENALRCQVCKDFYKTPMLTTCSHTFCSLCIRRALANDGKCPLCRSSEQELKLRSNWSLEETVEAFVKARPATLQLARNGGSSRSTSKRKAESESPQKGDAPEGKRVRTSARLRKNKVEQVTTDPIVEDEDEEVFEVPDTDGDDAYVPENDDGLVPCPVCQSRMKDWQVFKHLETCPGPAATPKKKKVGESSTFDRMQRQQAKPLERLPALNYSILREQALRKKLAELGISNQGPRNLLEKRHKEWITLWNANCDAARPKKRSELLHDLEIWEKTQGGRAPMVGRAAQNTTQVKDKEFDGAAWAAKHDSSFKDLIASARKSRMEAQKKAEEAGKSSSIESNDKPAEGSKLGFSSQPSRNTLEATTSRSYDNKWGNNNDGDDDEDPFYTEDVKKFYQEEEERERQRMQGLSAPPKHDIGPSQTYGGSALTPTQVPDQGNSSHVLQAGAAGREPTFYDHYSRAYRVANPTPQEYIDNIHIYAVDNFPIIERPDSAFPQRSKASSQPVVHTSEPGDSGNLSTPSASLPNGTRNSMEDRP